MLFFGILLNCLNPALTLACASDYRDPFILPMLPNDKKKAAAAKSHLASMFGGNSDQLAVVAAFECWMNAKKKGQEARFCSQYFVSSSTMNMLFGMRKQLQNELLRHGFIPEDVSNCSLNERNPGILHAVLVSGLYPMVARLLPPFKNTNRSMVETASGEKVRLHPHSSNFKLSFTKSSDQPLIIFDEITRGDGGMHIRNCSVVGPLPLLLLATEMVVVPIKDIDDDDDDNNNESDYEDADEDESDDDKIEMHNKLGEDYEEKVMSSPDNAVKVVVDRWLSFKSIALDVAQIYCLRERLSAAILLKVTHPRKVLSPLLEASLNAIASVLSYDGMSKISSPTEPVDSLTSMVNATEIDQSTHGKVKGMVQNSNGFLRSMPQAYRGTMSWNGPLSSHVQYPIASTHIKPYPRFAPQGPSGAISGPIALRGDSSKRQRGNWS